jgi:hypothetical protein
MGKFVFKGGFLSARESRAMTSKRADPTTVHCRSDNSPLPLFTDGVACLLLPPLDDVVPQFLYWD